MTEADNKKLMELVNDIAKLVGCRGLMILGVTVQGGEFHLNAGINTLEQLGLMDLRATRIRTKHEKDVPEQERRIESKPN
jgi:hypothetical protein